MERGSKGRGKGEWKGDRAMENWKVKGTEQKKTGRESGKGEGKGEGKWEENGMKVGNENGKEESE